MNNQSHTNNHRNQIGFKVTDNKLAVIENEIPLNSLTYTNDLPFEQQMKIKGLEQAIILITNYFNGCFPFRTDRDEYYFTELVKIRDRFFNPLL